MEEESPPTSLYRRERGPAADSEIAGIARAAVGEEVARRLDALQKAAAQEPEGASNGAVSPANTMPFIIDAVRAYATVGEICEALRAVYGTYTEVSITCEQPVVA